MHSQHNKSKSGHTVNISRAPAHTIQNNGDINIFRMASLQNTLNKHRLKNNLLSCFKPVNNLDNVLSSNIKS
jgi:hypothetical protein